MASEKRCECVNCRPDSVPFGYMPIATITPSSKVKQTQRTEIEEIVNFRYPKADIIWKAADVPNGEGEFLVKWKGHQQMMWMHVDLIFKTGLTAIRKYFHVVRTNRLTEERKHLDKLTHISSLYDFFCGGIVEETTSAYKLRIGGLTNNFLSHMSQKSERSPGVTIAPWEKKKRIHPTDEEIETMSKGEYEVDLVKKEEGYYSSESVTSSPSENPSSTRNEHQG